MKRILTAIILAPLVIAVVLKGPFLLFLAVAGTVALLCFREYSNLVEQHGMEKPGPAAYAAGVLLLVIPEIPFVAVTLITLLALALAMNSQPLSKSMPRAAAMVLGIIYIFGTWKAGILLWERSPYWLLFALALTWVGDIAAYYIGRWLGRHKLAPTISPGKSWEGSAASVLGSVLFGMIYFRMFAPELSPGLVLAFAAAGNLAGQLGDLAESALKRGAGVKDSGNLLPGHGGWLDRTDSTLFALPVIYALHLWLL